MTVLSAQYNTCTY